jgi:beta-lactamase regulating signal transducer with metallopeptidase domain
VNWLTLQAMTQNLAQTSVERILNALPLGVLVAVFAWVLLRILRRQNSGTRFAVWFLALLTVAALPVVGGFGEGQSIFAAGMSPGTWGSMRPAIHIPARWALFVFFAWAFGAGIAMARLMVGLCRVRRLRQSCTPIVAAELDLAVRKTIEAIGGSRSGSAAVSVATSESMRVPAAIGFWKRTIVLPAWTLRELPAADLNAVLLHEFEHLRRGDDWTNLIQKMVRALFFFHPAVWWIENRLSVEREMACDDAVLAQTSDPRGYAACLVSLLEKSLAHRLAQRPLEKKWSMVQAAVNRAREASLRLAQILDSNRPMATRVWKPALGIVGTFSVVCLMALPHAPQFVAFDRGTQGANSAYMASVARQSLQLASSAQALAAVVPAAWRIGETSGETSVDGAGTKPTTKLIRTRTIARDREVQTRFNMVSPFGRMIAVSANVHPHPDEEIIPEFQTVVFFEATQYGNGNSPVWQVQMWRVTMFSGFRERVTRVPVASSI